MARLKDVVAGLGYTGVRTYINSGNVLFEAEQALASAVAERIEEALARAWGLPIKVLVRSAEQIAHLVAVMPDHWRNDQEHKCDVLFLWEEALCGDFRHELAPKEGIDELIFTPGEIIWRVGRSDVTRSGLMKLAGTPLYALTTIRNANTVRKLAALMS